MMTRSVTMNPLALTKPAERFPSPHPTGRGIKGEGFLEKHLEVTL